MSEQKQIIVDGLTFRHLREVETETTVNMPIDDCVTSWEGVGVLQSCMCGQFRIRWEKIFRQHVREFT